ncbi:MAG: hypothetical protein KGJ90_00310 [Patescibacteria group bacterium]|nr:hypothetical protein [Patescibacteria group bacterium]
MDIEVEPGFNARDFSTPENQEHVRYLKTSIIEGGVKEPLTVRLESNGDGIKHVKLVGGECRLRAVLMAIEEGHEIHSVPCQSDDRYANDADRIAELITRNSGKQLTPLEQASVCKRLSAFGWDQRQIAKKLAYSDSYISQLLGLTTLPEEARKLVADGAVSAAAALNEVRTSGEVVGVETLKQAVEEAAADGKTKATPKRINEVRQEKVSRGVKLKPSGTVRNESTNRGLALGPVKTEATLAFLRWILAQAEDIDEVKAKADELTIYLLKQ